MKRCSACGDSKPISEYHKNVRSRDGLQGWCKPCHKIARDQWNADNPERRRELNKRWQADNRDRANTSHRERYAADPERYRAQARARYGRQKDRAKAWNRRRNLRKYGLSEGEYQSLLQAHGGVCAICKQPPKRKRLHVDHCHHSNLVRGLLCSNCNLGIGNLQDSPALLMAAIAYLARSVREVA